LREDFWTLSIIPHCGKRIRVYRISRWHLYLGAILVGSMICSLAHLAYGQIKHSTESRDFQVVQGENKALRDRLRDMEGTVSEIEERLVRMTAVEERFREVAGLPVIGKEVLDAGVGGPGIEWSGLDDRTLLDGSMVGRVKEADQRINLLFRRADLVYQGFIESVEQMEYYDERFSRTPSIWPTYGHISSRFGARSHPIFGEVRSHHGVDIYAPKGTPIRATADGRVERAGWKVGYGLSLDIDHEYGYQTFYAHCSKLKVRNGEWVKRGDVIAMVGSTGITTGSHLHYEVLVNGKSVNPTDYILGSSIPD